MLHFEQYLLKPEEGLGRVDLHFIVNLNSSCISVQSDCFNKIMKKEILNFEVFKLE
jgi:hypothetical protein